VIPFLPEIRRAGWRGAAGHGRPVAAVLVLGVAALACARQAPPTARTGTEAGEWRYYGGDAGSSRYSPLDRIDASNVARLEVAWRWSSASLGQERADSYLRTTSLKVGDRLYATAGSHRSVVALDPASGETLWVFVPDEPATAGRSRGGSGRGVAYWSDGENERVFFVSRGLDVAAARRRRRGRRRSGARRRRARPNSKDADQGRRARVRRAHRRAALDLSHDSRAGRVRLRQLARRLGRVHRQRRRLGADGRRSGARHRLPAGRSADQRHVWRRASGRQPVRQQPRRGRRASGRARLAPAADSSRHLGLGQSQRRRFCSTSSTGAT
jgi:hypothetical protein